MTGPHNSTPDSDQLQSALEASCDALMTLQSMDREATNRRSDGSSPWLHVTEAIESLRSAITELRLARDEEESMVGLGFVVRRARRG
jgi:hypothetical protein